MGGKRARIVTVSQPYAPPIDDGQMAVDSSVPPPDAKAFARRRSYSLMSSAVFFYAILIAFGMQLASGVFAAEVLYDKQDGAASLLRLAGVGHYLYWLSFGKYHWIVYYLVPSLGIIGAMLGECVSVGSV